MRTTVFALGLAAALAAAPAVAAPAGPGYGCTGNGPVASGCPGGATGYGMGPGYGMGGMGSGYGMGGMGPGYGPGNAYGRGYGPGMGRSAGDPLLTPEERLAFRDRMHEVKTLAECNAAWDEHRALVESRAKERGITLPEPRGDMCERMAVRGRFN